MSVLYFGAKRPEPGRVKTRLGESIGFEAAANVYAAFLDDLDARFRGAPFPVAWYVVQVGSDWAARQAHLFRCAAGQGEGRVVLAATDSPQLTVERVLEAFAALERADVVFGPTFDGGYYLVGMTGFHDVFAGVAMSTDSALERALQRARRSGLRCACLAPEFDVDTAADLAPLRAELARRADMPATAAALAGLRHAPVVAA